MGLVSSSKSTRNPSKNPVMAMEARIDPTPTNSSPELFGFAIALFTQKTGLNYNGGVWEPQLKTALSTIKGSTRMSRMDELFDVG